MIDPHLRVTIVIGITTMTIEIGTGSADLDLAPIILDIGVTVAVTHRSCSRSFHQCSHCSTSCHRSSSTYHYQWDMLHHRSSSCRSFSRDNSRSRTHTSHKHHHKTSTRLSSSSDQTPWKTKDRKYKQVTIDDPPSEYYSSDEQDSDSEDDLN